MNTAAAICAVNWFKGGRGRIGFGRARCFFTTKRDNNSSLQYEWGTGYTNANLISCFPATRISILHRSVIASLSPNWIQTKYFYTVRMGRIPGIHDNWEDCKSQVQGFHGDEYKKFSSRIEAKEYVAAHEVNGTRCMIKNAFVKDLERGQDAYKNQVEEPLAKATKSKGTKKNDETESNEAKDLVKASSQLEEPLPKAIKSKRTRKKLDETESNEDLVKASSQPEEPLPKAIKSKRTRKKLDETESNEAFYMLEFDGACKENPGKAGAGALLRSQDGKVVYELREGVGIATNNVAEYRAVILGLKVALSKGISRIHVRGDSKLVCKQIQGLWKTKNENMAKLCAEAKELKAKFKEFHIKHIYREFNSDADALANAAVNLQNGEWLASKVGLQDSSDASSLVQPLEISAKSRSLKKIGVIDCDKDLFQVLEKSLEKISKSRKARKKLDATDSNEDLFQVADKPLEKISKSKKARKKLDATGSDEDLFQVSEKPIEMITKSRKSRKKLVATDSNEEFNSDADALANAALKLQNGKCLSSRVDANGHTA